MKDAKGLALGDMVKELLFFVLRMRDFPDLAKARLLDKMSLVVVFTFNSYLVVLLFFLFCLFVFVFVFVLFLFCFCIVFQAPYFRWLFRVAAACSPGRSVPASKRRSGGSAASFNLRVVNNTNYYLIFVLF